MSPFANASDDGFARRELITGMSEGAFHNENVAGSDLQLFRSRAAAQFKIAGIQQAPLFAKGDIEMMVITIFFSLLKLYTALPALSAPQNRDCDIILDRPLEFVGETIESCISRADIERLMNNKVELGSSEDDAYEFLQSNTGAVRVETCNEYLMAIRQGAYPSGSKFDIAMGSSFVYTCGTLSALQSAEKAKKSFLPDGKLKHLEMLPVILLPYALDELLEESNTGHTIADYLGNQVEILQSTPDELQLFGYGIDKSDTAEIGELTPEERDAETNVMYMWSIARADFNKDGVEDILVWVGDEGLMLLTRTSATQKKFEVLAGYFKCQYKDSKYVCSSEFGWSPPDKIINIGYKASLVRLEAVKALRGIKHPKSQELELLLSALKDEYYKVQLETIQILAEINDSTVVQPLSEAIKDDDLEVRIQAIKTLGKIKDPRIVQVLIDAIKDENLEVRELAIDTLGDIKDPKAIPALIDALKDEHWPIQWAARRALVDITGNDLGAYWENWQEWWNKKK